MTIVWKWLRAFALLGFLVFSPTSLSAKNLCPDLTGQVYDPTDDIIVTTYHSHMGASFGGPITWGEDMGSDGHDQLLMNLVIPANGYNYTGDVLMLTASGNSAAQGFVLTTDGLWSWGPVAEVVDMRSPDTAIGQMSLPSGVSPTDILDIKANSDVFFIVTTNGEVWVAGQNVVQVSGNTDTTANTWHKVETSVGVALTGVVELTGSREVVYVRKSDNTVWTWGRGVALGNGTPGTDETYATQVSSVGLPGGVTLSQLGTYFDNNANSSGILALGSDQKLYGLGYNSDGRLINNGANTFVDIWTEVSTPLGESVLFVSTSDNSEEYASAAIITSPGGGAKNRLYTWGEVNNNNIGHGSSGLVENPSVPAGFVVGTNDPVYTSVGGHAMSFAEKANGGQICFVGHIINGSTGGLTTTANSFSCVGGNSPGWPADADLCFQTPPEGNVTGSVKHKSGTPISGVTIQIQDASGNVVNDANGAPLTTMTLADGTYRFDHVITDDYFIVQIDNPTYISLSDGDDTDDGDAHTNTDTNDNIIPVTVLKNEVDADNNFIDTFPPTATDNSNNTNEDNDATGNVLTDDDGNGIDSDPDGDSLNVSQFVVDGVTYNAGDTATLVNVGTITIAINGDYTFSPVTNYSGSVPTVTYTISDGEGGTDTSTLDITVTAVSDPMSDGNENVTTPEDTPITGNVMNVTDADSTDHTLTTFTVGGTTYNAGQTATLANVGTITIAANGAYTFTPENDFNGAVPQVNYAMVDDNDATDTDTSTLDITVGAVNDGPVAEDDSQSTAMNTAVAVPVLNNDHDPEGDTLTIIDVNTTGTEGNVTFDANGTVIFTPDTDFVGTTTFTYTISDGNGGTATATVTITIIDPTDPANNAVTAVADSASTEVDTAVDIPVVINDYDPDYDDFNLTGITSQPANGTATINDNGTPNDASDDYIEYTPSNGFVGTDTFTYEITDEHGNTDTAIVTVTVVDSTVTDPVPNAVADAVFTEEDTAVNIDVLDNDSHPNTGEERNITGFTQPANGVVTIDDGGTPNDPSDDQFIYTPNTGFVGHDTFMYTITDSNGDSASAAVTVTLKSLRVTLIAFCENDVPYISYDIRLQGLDPSGQTATLTWTGAGGDEEIVTGLPLNDTHYVWAGAQVDGSGNGTVWPGWIEHSDGTWEEVFSDWRRWNPDQSDAMVTVTLSVNPASSVTVQYPPATSVCSANPLVVQDPGAAPAPPPGISASGLPNATDNLNVPITHYGATVINVLANGDSFGSNGPGTVEIKFTQPIYGTVGLDDGGTANDPTDDVLIYTPAADLNNLVDKFTYTITDAAGNTSTATVSLNVNCASSQTSDGGDALGTFSIMLMMFLTLMTGLYFARKEEMRKEEKGEV
ncbi:MAG: hypothetical protein COB07_01790 [Sulfurovum sp.]|nr:MAG: hypothetical protein COB07_01790 [Sulfurovum sp.]